jgi:hypothetical protein
MIGDNLLHSGPVAAAIEALAGPGVYLIPSGELSRLIRVDSEHWGRFACNWEDLELDRYMADGGRYRYRRYGRYELDSVTETLVPLPNEPHRQERDVNPLNGGVDRIYEPLTASFTEDPLLRDLLVFLGKIFSAADGTRLWNIQLFPNRIIAGVEAGHPTPEGRHRDGVKFVISLLAARRNISGGESSVYTNDGQLLLSTTLAEPGDLLLSDDERTLHSVTPVLPVDPEAPAHRDVLVALFDRVRTTGGGPA